MQSLSVTNLQVLELDNYNNNNNNNINNNVEPHHRYLKSNDKYLNINNNYNNTNNNNSSKFSLKLNFQKFTSNSSSNKYDISRNDSGYMSCNSAETVFSIDNSNYVSFRHNPYLLNKRQYQSTQSLYDKSLLDLSEVFGLNFNPLLSNNENSSPNVKNQQKVLSFSVINTTKKVSEERDFQSKFENRNWDQIYKLSDVALNQWLSYSRRTMGRNLVNNTLDGNKTFQYFEPNSEVKNSLLLNSNLLYQPIRRCASELNLRKLVFESSQLFADDYQLESQVSCDEDLGQYRKSFAQTQMETDVKNTVTQDIYGLFMDLHEFRISDRVIDSVSDKICKIDRYLLSQIRGKDLANYMFSKNLCGCRLSSICSVIQFSQALSQIVVECIDTKIAVYQRIAYIIAFIKLSMSLYQKSNWQSLNTLICALHSFKIYRMNNEWHQIKLNHKHYFDEFIKLTAIIRSSETSLMYTIPRGIPALKNLLLTTKMDCMSKWDRMERPAKWIQQPGIIDWLERELNYKLIKTSEQERQKTGDCLSSDFSIKQFICFIPMSKMPENWLNRSLKNIPLEYKHRMSEYLSRNLKNQLKF